jgi:NitT/TauT family transport system substrate-binding protein
MKIHSPKYIIVTLLCAVLFTPPSVLRAQDRPGPEKVRIAIASHSLAFLVPFVAKDRGLYAKHGIEAEIIQVRPNVAMAALLSGDIDYVELIGSIIRSAGRGAPVRAISTSIKAPFFSFAAHNKFKTIKDLKGATIGVTAIGGTNYVSTRLTLRHYGLDPDKDVKILVIGDEKLMYEAFKIGRVDSVVVAPPFSVILRREGFPLLAHTGELLNFPFSGLGTTLDKIGKNRAQVRKLLRGEIEALRFVRANPTDTTDVIRKRLTWMKKWPGSLTRWWSTPPAATGECPWRAWRFSWASRRPLTRFHKISPQKWSSTTVWWTRH